MKQSKKQQFVSQAQNKKANDQTYLNGLIPNYYGAHKTYKTQFRNKKFKNVYNQLIHRKPAHQKHFDMYYEDLLASIIKTIQWSFYSKQNFIENIEPFYHFGKQTIKDYYSLFLQQKRIIDNQFDVDHKKDHKISYFLSLCIDFSAKMAFFLKQEGDYVNAQRILISCYEMIIKEVIKSATSNIRLLMKCVRFFQIYIVFCLERKLRKLIPQLIQDSLTILMNLIIISNFHERSYKKKRNFKSYIKILKLVVKTLISFAIFKEEQCKYLICHSLIQDIVELEKGIKILCPKVKAISIGLNKIFRNQSTSEHELIKICNKFFKKEDIQKLGIHKPVPIYPYNFTVKFCRTISGDLRPEQIEKNKRSNLLNAFYRKNNPNNLKQVRFQLAEQEERYSNKTSLEGNSGVCLKTRSQINSNKKFNSLQKKPSLSINQIANDSQYLSINKLGTVEDFTTLIRPRRVTSTAEKKCRTNSFSRRKISQNPSTKYISANQAGEAQMNKQIISNQNLLKFSCKDTKKLVRKKNSKFGNFDFNKKIAFIHYENAQENMEKWHNQAAQIQTEINGKIQKLKQKKNTNQLVQLANQNTNTKMNIKVLPIQKPVNKSKRKLSEKNIQAKFVQLNRSKTIQQCKKTDWENLHGLNLLRQILIENKKEFKIKNMQLFAIKHENGDLTKNDYRKSFISRGHLHSTDNTLNKNHEQALKSIQFFMREYENVLGIKGAKNSLNPKKNIINVKPSRITGIKKQKPALNKFLQEGSSESQDSEGQINLLNKSNYKKSSKLFTSSLMQSLKQ